MTATFLLNKGSVSGHQHKTYVPLSTGAVGHLVSYLCFAIVIIHTSKCLCMARDNDSHCRK